MYEMNLKRFVVVVIAVTLSILMLNGCIVIKDSPAPGCIKRLGRPPLTGCMGKTVLQDLVVEPKFNCLRIGLNNCNGGIIEVYNECREALVLNGISIGPNVDTALDVILKDNQHVLAETDSNFSRYRPALDQSITLVGTLGEENIRISFTKTAPLCE